MYVCDHFRFLPFSKQTYALQPTVNSEAPYEKLVNIIVSYSSSIASVWVIPVYTSYMCRPGHIFAYYISYFVVHMQASIWKPTLQGC